MVVFCGGEHPRVCGENPSLTLKYGCVQGTSPRMRGKPQGPDLHSAGKFRGRNIPAYAGKTISLPPSATPTAEHPRVCGENSRFPRLRHA